MTDVGLCGLTALTLLQRLDIGGCVAVSVRGIGALARSLRHLSCLKVSTCQLLAMLHASGQHLHHDVQSGGAVSFCSQCKPWFGHSWTPMDFQRDFGQLMKEVTGLTMACTSAWCCRGFKGVSAPRCL